MLQVAVGGVEACGDEQQLWIEGAHEGRGIGDLFLGHIERCAVLLHLVDGTADEVAEDYQTIITELEAYGEGLADKPRITALNKIDSLDDELRAMQREALEEAVGGPVMMMSGVSGEGLTDVLRALKAEIDDNRLRYKKAEEAEDDEEDGSWHP